MSEPQTAIEYERTDERLPRIGRRVRLLVGWAAVAMGGLRLVSVVFAIAYQGRFGVTMPSSKVFIALPLNALLLIGGVLMLNRMRAGLRCVQAWTAIDILLSLVGVATIVMSGGLSSTPGMTMVLIGTASNSVVPALLLGLTLSPLREVMFPADNDGRF